MLTHTTGFVLYFDEDVGYGYFSTSDGKRVFIHRSVLQKYQLTAADLMSDTPVEFDYSPDRRRRDKKECVRNIHTLNGKPLRLVPIKLEPGDTVFGCLVEKTERFARLRIVARGYPDGSLEKFPKSRRTELFVHCSNAGPFWDQLSQNNEFYKLKVIVDQGRKAGLIERVALDADGEDRPIRQAA